jgi:peptidoglycan/LPS O-acetylase OafA/YrhL
MSKESLPKAGYRTDIDGLRAVAVMLVVMGHLGFNHLSGGFVGVDVFFVISGYLISSIILSQIQSSSFSILSFYERRIRRIVPALFVMMLVTCLLAYKILLPTELTDFAKSLIAATFSASNFYFWTQAGYFDTPAAFKPLLHTWSLGVEEQFYIVFPLLLLAVRKLRPAKLHLSIMLFAAISFAISAVGAFKYPDSTFYLAHTRAWELLLGTLVWMRVFPELRQRALRETASLLGIALILFAGVSYSPKTHFPGIAALAPCLGAGLIIAAGQSGETLVGKMLSLRPVVFIGLISYSLYLWHWPLLVFQAIGHIFGVYWGSTGRWVILAVSLVVATFSWKWIEGPFRVGAMKLSGPALFKATAATVVCTTLLAASALLTHGFSSRYSPEARNLESYLAYTPTYREGTCFFTSKEHGESVNTAACLTQDPTKKNFLLIGDSHAAQLWYGLSTVFDTVNVMQVTASGCRGVLHSIGDSHCVDMMNSIYSSYLPAHHVDKLLLASQWEPKDLPAIAETAAWANQHGIDLVIFGPIVEYDASLPRLLVVSMTTGDRNGPFNHRLQWIRQFDDQMSDLAGTRWKVQYISYFKLLCDSKSCIEYADPGVPLQFDHSHLTSQGSVFVAEKLKESHQLP